MGADGFDLTYLAFGAGLDSHALLLASEKGLLGVPRAAVAIFADVDGQAPVEETAEPAWVLEAVWRAAERASSIPGAIPIHVASAGEGLVAGLRRRQRTGHGRGANPPLFTLELVRKNPDLFGQQVLERANGQLRRGCTPSFKIEVMERYVRALLGVRAVRRRKSGPYSVRVRGLVGISADEADRVKPSRLPWITLEWPFVAVGVSRADEEALLRAHGWPVPRKSACVFCPFHSDAYWRYLRQGASEEWAKACRFDAEFRRLRGVRGQSFVHASRLPLAAAPLDGRRATFSNECSGLCGA